MEASPLIRNIFVDDTNRNLEVEHFEDIFKQARINSREVSISLQESRKRRQFRLRIHVNDPDLGNRLAFAIATGLPDCEFRLTPRLISSFARRTTLFRLGDQIAQKGVKKQR